MRAFLAAACAASLLGGAGHAQEGAFGGAPTGVPMPSPGDIPFRGHRGEAAKPNPDACGMVGRSQTLYPIARAHALMGACEHFDQDLWQAYYLQDYYKQNWEVIRDWPTPRQFDASVIGYFAQHEPPFDYMEGLARSGGLMSAEGASGLNALAAAMGDTLPTPPTGRRDTPAFVGSGGAAPQAASGAAVSRAPTQQATTAPPAPGETGACGVAVSTGLTAEAQAEAERLGTCEQIAQLFGGQ